MKDTINKLKEELEIEPAYYKFRLPKECELPEVIFEGASDIEQVRKYLSGKFIVENPSGEKATRELCIDELADIRRDYAKLLEEELPVLEKEVADVEARCKNEAKTAKDRLQALHTKINDLIAEAREGTREMPLPSELTAKLAINGQYAYYTWVDGQFRLCKVVKIPDWDNQTLFANQQTNREAFREVLGVEFAEGDVQLRLLA